MKLEFFEDGLNGGQLILLYGGGREEVGLLRMALHGLADGIGRHVTVDELPFVTSVANCRLRAVSAETDVGVVATPTPRDFKWALAPESWRQVEGLLRPFCDQQSGGNFQHLNSARGPEIIYSTERAW